MLKKLRPRFLTMAFSIFSVMILILTACGASGTPSPSGNAGKPVKGGTFTDDLYEDVDSLIPNGITETYAFLVDQAIWCFFRQTFDYIPPQRPLRTVRLVMGRWRSCADACTPFQ